MKTDLYSLVVEAKLQENIKAAKQKFNGVLADIKEERTLFTTDFATVNESKNIDTSDVSTGFKKASSLLKEAKALIREAEEASKPRTVNEKTKAAMKKISEIEQIRESTMKDFHSVVKIAESM